MRSTETKIKGAKRRQEVVDLSLTLSRVKLHVNWINSQNQRHGLPKWIKQQVATIAAHRGYILIEVNKTDKRVSGNYMHSIEGTF